MAEPQDIAAKAATSTWDDIRLWGAVVISFASLVWSERNRRIGEKNTSKLRQENVRLDEFRSGVKGPLLEALKDCEDAAMKAEAIAHSGQALDQVEQNVKDLNRSTIEALSKVEMRLSDANASDFANGEDWLDAFNGFEDKILGAFNEASNTVNSDVNRRHALLKVKTQVGALRADVKRRIDLEIKAITADAQKARLKLPFNKLLGPLLTK